MVSWTHPEKAVSRLNSDALVTQLPSSSLIDTPENCGKCKFISEFWCRAMGARRVPNNDVVPVWCPLNPLPEKDMESYFPDEFGDGYSTGWNACIDVITREVE